MPGPRSSGRRARRGARRTPRPWLRTTLVASLAWMGAVSCVAHASQPSEQSAGDIALVRIDNALQVLEVDTKRVKKEQGTGDVQFFRLPAGTHTLRMKLALVHETSVSRLTETSEDLRLSIVVEAGHRYLLTCRKREDAVWAAVLIDESKALEATTPRAPSPWPMTLRVVVADTTFTLSGGDTQQLNAMEALLRRSAKNLNLSNQADAIRFRERYLREREEHQELVSVGVVCPSIPNLDEKR